MPSKMTPKVLVAPLDWGLGHATRCIPVVRKLVDIGAEVTLCASGGGRALLSNRFPSLEMIDIPSYQVSYPRSGNMAWSMMLQTIPLMRSIRKENEILERMVRLHKFTHIISDNRYGLFSRSAKNAIITHQLNVLTPKHLNIFKPLINGLVKRYIDHFDECWVPDMDSKLSGELSRPQQQFVTPLKDVGILSRFEGSVNQIRSSAVDVISVISGPEPQRTIFADMVKQYYTDKDIRVMIAGGQPELGTNVIGAGNITIRNDIDDMELLSLLSEDTLYIGRSGYSTVMDLASIGHRKALLVPTPGQTEQEYLARYLADRYGTTITEQQNMSIPDKINETTWPENTAAGRLKKVLTSFLGT